MMRVWVGFITDRWVGKCQADQIKKSMSSK